MKNIFKRNMCYKMMKNDVNGKTNSKKNNPDICLDVWNNKKIKRTKKRFWKSCLFRSICYFEILSIIIEKALKT